MIAYRLHFEKGNLWPWPVRDGKIGDPAFSFGIRQQVRTGNSRLQDDWAVDRFTT